MPVYPKAPRIIGMVGRRGSGKDTATAALRCFGYKQIAFAGALKAMMRTLLKERRVPFDTIESMIDGASKELRATSLQSPVTRSEAEAMVRTLLEFQGVTVFDGDTLERPLKELGFHTPAYCIETLCDYFSAHAMRNDTPRHWMQVLGTEWGRQTIHDQLWVNATMNAIAAEPDRRFCISDARFVNEANAVHAASGKLIRIRRPARDTTGDTHASEVELEQIAADFEIVNDSNGIELFQQSVADFYNQTFA